MNSCQHCKWFKEVKPGGIEGQCRRYPPRLSMGPVSIFESSKRRFLAGGQITLEPTFAAQPSNVWQFGLTQRGWDCGEFSRFGIVARFSAWCHLRWRRAFSGGQS